MGDWGLAQSGTTALAEVMAWVWEAPILSPFPS